MNKAKEKPDDDLTVSVKMNKYINMTLPYLLVLFITGFLAGVCFIAPIMQMQTKPVPFTQLMEALLGFTIGLIVMVSVMRKCFKLIAQIVTYAKLQGELQSWKEAQERLLVIKSELDRMSHAAKDEIIRLIREAGLLASDKKESED